MAPLPPNSTARVYFDYVTGAALTSREHTVQWRANLALATVDLVQAKFLGFLQAVGASNLRQGWKVIRVRVCLAGSNFSVPVNPTAALGGFVGTYAGSYNARMECVEDTYQFRSLSSGRRGDFSLYRAQGDADENFRFGMPTAQQTALLDAANNASLMAIDNTSPGVYTYVNQNYNSYWETRSRTT